MTDPSNPVIAAIETRREELGLQETALEEALEATRAELFKLAQAQEVLSAAGSGQSDPPPAPEQPPSEPSQAQEPSDESSEVSSPPVPDLPDGLEPEPEPDGAANEITTGKKPRAVRTYERRQALLKRLEVYGANSKSQLQRELPAEAMDSTSSLIRDLAALIAEGQVRLVGAGNQTRYEFVPEDERTVVPGQRQPTPSAGEQEITVGEGTPDGRVLEYCQLNPKSSGPAIALGTGISLNDVRPILGGLIRERLVRPGHKNGETVYTGQPG